MKLSLGTRTQIIVACTLAVVFGAALYISVRALHSNFREYETHEASDELARAQEQINEHIRQLEAHAKDYGAWDDTVRFIEGEYPKYPSVDIDTSVYGNLDIDLVVITDLHGKVLYQAMRMRDYPGTRIRNGIARKDELGDIPEALLRKISSLAPISERRSGLLEFGGAPVAVAGYNVTHSNGEGQFGTIFMGKVLDATVMEKYSRLAQTGVALSPASPAQRMAGEKIEIGAHSWTARKLIAGHAWQGLFLLTTTGERDMLPQLRTSELVLGLNLVLLSVVCVVLVSAVLYRLVLRRIRNFAMQADLLSKGDDETLRMPVSRNNDELDYLAGALNGLVDALQSTQQRIIKDAESDCLTGLGNRSFLMNRLSLACALRERDPNYRFALYMIDLDGFKNINDSFGHNTGDQVLRIIAGRILSHTRQSDTAVRLGGDEFVILQMNTGSAQDSDAFARRIISGIAEPFQCDGQILDITASMGISMSIDLTDKRAPQDFLRDADIAMYAAKKEGKNRHSFFCTEMGSMVSERLALVHDMKAAIGRGELEVWYQPIVSLAEGKVVELEALARWRHPSRGLITPDFFIPIAEESNMIVALDRWVLDEALGGLSRMRAIEPNLSVSVNVSIRNFLQPDLTDVITAALKDKGLPPQALSVELTETDIARNEATLVGEIRQLTDLGVRCLMDDFGSGYSSLGRLDLLPVHTLKMDRAFIRRINEGDRRIVEAVINMAHALEKKVVAEGIETELQVEVLQSLGCDLFQGYLFARPMPEPELTQLLKEGILALNRP